MVAAAAAVLVFAASFAQAATTFVQDQRVNALTLQFGTDTFATHNAFGGAIVGVAAQADMRSALSSHIANGAISWLLEMRDLTDLSGTADPSLHVEGRPTVSTGK